MKTTKVITKILITIFILIAGNSISQENPLIGTWNKVSGPGDPTKYIFQTGSTVIVQVYGTYDTANFLNSPIYMSSLNNICLGKNGIGMWLGVYTVSGNTLQIEGYWHTGENPVPTPQFFNTPTTYVRSSFGIKVISLEIPSTFSLSQNYPNPFNPITKIRFDLPKNVNVKLTIYDMLGKEIETIVNEHLNAGSYEVTFDGTKYTSGVYYYRLNAGEFVETKKMILVK